jgi:hypothetical protein
MCGPRSVYVHMIFFTLLSISRPLSALGAHRVFLIAGNSIIIDLLDITIGH